MIKKCGKKINDNKLILNIDISKLESWNLNTELDVNNIKIWDKSKCGEELLLDYGLTAYDTGLTATMETHQNIALHDNRFKMKHIGFNDEFGVHSFLNHEINPIIDNSVGNYFNFNGGYLQGVFKYYGYDYEVLPARFMSGITIEVMLNTDDNSEGIFVYMGVRSDDKYNPLYFPERDVFTSDNNTLNATIKQKKIFDKFNNYDDGIYYDEEITYQQIDNIKNNAISFSLNSNKTLNITYIDGNGDLREDTSTYKLPNGWNLLSFTFKPEHLLGEYDDMYYCPNRRIGTMYLHVNGIMEWKIDNFTEFYFKKIFNTREKQIGVPFNISLGGGSYGLKHSYHYNKTNTYLYNGDDINYINNNFSIYGGFIQNQIDDYFIIQHNNSDTLIVEYDNTIELLTGHINEFRVKYALNNIYNYHSINNQININLQSNTNIEIIEEGDNDVDGFWRELYIKFKTNKEGGFFYINPKIILMSSLNFNINSTIYIKDFNFIHNNLYSKDTFKDDLYVEKYFNKPFYGGIQKFRIYDRMLSFNEITDNALAEFKNTNYNVNAVRGGRIINL